MPLLPLVSLREFLEHHKCGSHLRNLAPNSLSSNVRSGALHIDRSALIMKWTTRRNSISEEAEKFSPGVAQNGFKEENWGYIWFGIVGDILRLPNYSFPTTAVAWDEQPCQYWEAVRETMSGPLSTECIRRTQHPLFWDTTRCANYGLTQDAKIGGMIESLLDWLLIVLLACFLPALESLEFVNCFLSFAFVSQWKEETIDWEER